MCVDRMRSIIIAIIIGVSMGLAGNQEFKLAFIMQLLLIIALLVDGATGFCPVRAVLKNVLPPCNHK
ncbi:MAG: hypothetical protein DSY76_08630 [Bacteroidetes bacterium]|nr:MAG: hypothetical protein DSY76_08630 [Bacteroidota bacterium]